jgi:carbonic anhydrase
MRTHYKDLPKDARAETCVEENVLAQIENLRTHPAVFAALTRGELNLHAWVYSLENGGVEAYDPECGQFIPVTDAPHGHSVRPELLGVLRKI